MHGGGREDRPESACRETLAVSQQQLSRRNIVFKFIYPLKMMQLFIPNKHLIYTLKFFGLFFFPFFPSVLGIIVFLVSSSPCQSDWMGTDPEGCDHHPDSGRRLRIT